MYSGSDNSSMVVMVVMVVYKLMNIHILFLPSMSKPQLV